MLIKVAGGRLPELLVLMIFINNYDNLFLLLNKNIVTSLIIFGGQVSKVWVSASMNFKELIKYMRGPRSMSASSF